MNYLFPVSVDSDVLAEFIDGIELAHQNIERLSIFLEKSPEDILSIEKLREIFKELSFSSSKVDFVPISESLHEILKCLDMLLRFNKYPAHMSEFILLLIDRLLMVSRDIKRNYEIDIRKTQHILVALQHILLVENAMNIDDGIEKAIKAITQDIYDNIDGHESDHSEVTLFDEVELFEETAKEEIPVNPLSIDIYLPKESLNPILEARDYIKEILDGRPVILLAKISDIATDHGDSHTQFLLELSLAINAMAGTPIDAEGLAVGVCGHDIALSAIPNILCKKERLTEIEINEIREHPLLGAELIKELNCPPTAIDVVLEHHERLDGKGYPYGIKNESISDAGKLVGIVDSFHGMTHNRPHKKYTKNILRAVAEINACVDTQYDRSWVKQFNNCIRKYWLPLQVR